MTIKQLMDKKQTVDERIERLRHLKNAINKDNTLHDELVAIYKERSGESIEVTYVIDQAMDSLREYDRLLSDIMDGTKITWPPRCREDNNE